MQEITTGAAANPCPSTERGAENATLTLGAQSMRGNASCRVGPLLQFWLYVLRRGLARRLMIIVRSLILFRSESMIGTITNPISANIQRTSLLRASAAMSDERGLQAPTSRYIENYFNIRPTILFVCPGLTIFFVFSFFMS